MITEDYVSFEVAKLLKEKGFNEKCIATYNLTTGTFEIEEIYQDWTNRWKAYVSAPTLQSANKWLRKIHKVDIEISIEYMNSKKVYYYSVLKKTIIRDIDCLHSETNFNSYEEACEAGIRYTLENLI